jgi:hypothetical protein
MLPDVRTSLEAEERQEEERKVNKRAVAGETDSDIVAVKISDSTLGLTIYPLIAVLEYFANLIRFFVDFKEQSYRELKDDSTDFKTFESKHEYCRAVPNLSSLKNVDTHEQQRVR